MTKQVTSNGGADITLKDVVIHMQHMEHRLTTRIDRLDVRMDALEDSLTNKMDTLELKLTHRMDKLEYDLTKRMDALEEDLTSTIKDTIAIKQHVGMAQSDEF